MENLYINPNWNFKETVDNARTLKETYNSLLVSFSYYDLHEKVVFMKTTRDSIYALRFSRKKKDKIWEYMNNYEFLYVLKGMAKRKAKKNEKISARYDKNIQIKRIEM